LTGQQIQERGNVEVLLGTPIDWMLEQVNYQPAKVERLIMGGPMMGFTLRHYHVPVVKTTNCILAPSLKELPLAPPAQACIRCGLCAEVCPAELLPQQLYWFSRAEEYEKAEHHNLFDCIECGACSYVCPSSIPLVQYYRYAKGEIKQQRENKRKSDHARERFEARQQRLEQEQLEKAAKRKERAEAAAKAQAAKLAQAKKEPAISSAEISKAEAQETQGQTPVTQAPVVEKIDLAELKLTWEKAQAKLDKMYDALDDAKANNPEQVDKLKRAVEKNQMRTNQAKSAWQKAEKAQKNQESTFSQTQNNSAIQETEKPDLEVLALTLEKAESKLAKMEDALAQAAEDQKEKLTRAVDKNKVRVEQAKQALQDAKAALAHSNQVNIVSVETVKPDIDALTLALEKAESKLTKMEDALAQAADDQREKLTRAVDKNKARVDAAKHALAEAKQQVNLESIDQADGGKS
jgi:electron transport complex protein RnfC